MPTSKSNLAYATNVQGSVPPQDPAVDAETSVEAPRSVSVGADKGRVSRLSYNDTPYHT